MIEKEFCLLYKIETTHYTLNAHTFILCYEWIEREKQQQNKIK